MNVNVNLLMNSQYCELRDQLPLIMKKKKINIKRFN